MIPIVSLADQQHAKYHTETKSFISFSFFSEFYTSALTPGMMIVVSRQSGSQRDCSKLKQVWPKQKQTLPRAHDEGKISSCNQQNLINNFDFSEILPQF